MDRLIIYSPKYGKHLVLFDEEDFELVKKYKWFLHKAKNCLYAKAWVVEGTKYIRIISMHRLIFGFPESKIDHADRNGLNNKKSNLRLCTHGQNMQNASKPSTNTSGFKGIVYDKKKQLWIVQVHVNGNGKQTKFGRFKSKYAAALKYNEVAIKHFGEFANINVLTDAEIEMSKEIFPRRIQKSNKTGYAGVTSYRNKYCAKISHGNIVYHVGYFDTPKNAAIARNEFIVKNNFPSTKLNSIT